MADQTEKPKLGTRPPLGLKRTVETGKVKQSFSHGRSNTVVVEVKRRRVLGPSGASEAPQQESATAVIEPTPARVEELVAPKPEPKTTERRPMTALERREQQDRLLREAE